MPSGGVAITATARLRKDYQQLMRDPVPYVSAAPLSSNMLDWHYVIRGAPNTPFDGGFYHGRLVFPIDFPFKPPSIYMLTPSGRFQPNVRICLSISDYHPDTWNPTWTISTIIIGLVSFMNESSPTMGSMTTTDAEKCRFARASLDFNLRDTNFCNLFPELATELRQKLTEEFKQIVNTSDQQNNTESDQLTIAYNLVLLAGVIAIAFAVKHIVLAAAAASS